MYGLALVLLEVATGHDIATGEDLAQLAYATTRASVRPTPRRLGLTVTDELEAVLTKALAVRPENRFENAGTLWSALIHALGVESLASPPSISRLSPVDPPPSSQRRPSITIESADTIPTPGPTAAASPTAEPASAAAVRMGRRATRRRWAIPAVLLDATLACAATAASVSHLHAAQRQALATNVGAAVAQPPPVVAPPACPEGMVLVPASKFFMGSDAADATPLEKRAATARRRTTAASRASTCPRRRNGSLPRAAPTVGVIRAVTSRHPRSA